MGGLPITVSLLHFNGSKILKFLLDSSNEMLLDVGHVNAPNL